MFWFQNTRIITFVIFSKMGCSFRPFIVLGLSHKNVGTARSLPTFFLYILFNCNFISCPAFMFSQLLSYLKLCLMTVFQQRATTAVVFSAVMLTGLFWNAWSFHLLFLVIAMGSIWEFLELTLPNETYKTMRKIIGVGAGFTLVGIQYYMLLQFELSDFKPSAFFTFDSEKVINLLLCLSFLFLIIELFLKASLPFNNIAIIVFSLFYIAIPFSLLQVYFFSLGRMIVLLT
jgi:hypothetical protein